MERNSVAPDVATPMWRRSTLFCTARINTCITMPSPAPSNAMYRFICHMGVSSSSRLSSPRAITCSSVPAIGNRR
ncbi:hypothetical protein D3C76_1515680 [compost metagenome]